MHSVRMVRVRVKYMIIYIFIPYSSRDLRFLPKIASPTPFSAPAGANPAFFAENPTCKQIFAIFSLLGSPGPSPLTRCPGRRSHFLLQTFFWEGTRRIEI